MPISTAGKRIKPGRPTSSQRGFTLIELLVVVTIISILSVGVGVTGSGLLSRGANSATSIAQQFEMAVRDARDVSLLSRRETGVFPFTNGWQTVVREGPSRWVSLRDEARIDGLQIVWLVQAVRFSTRVESDARYDTPVIAFAEDGSGTPFVATLGLGRDRVECRFEGWGEVTCQ